MYVEKFLQQVNRPLNENGILNTKLRDNCIEVFERKMSSLKSMEMAVCFTLLINNIEMWLTRFTKKYNHLCLIKKITWAMTNCY